MCLQILLSLGNTLWLDPLISCSHLKNVDTVVTEVSLRTELLNSKLAVENPDHMKTLLNLCKQAQIEIPDYQKGNTKCVIADVKCMLDLAVKNKKVIYTSDVLTAKRSGCI